MSRPDRALLRRLPLRLRELGAVVVALSLGYVVADHAAVFDRDEPPFVHSTARGATAHLSYGDVQLHDVRTAKYLTPVSPDDPTIIGSPLFVVAVLEVTATHEPTSFYSTWLVDDEGRTYRPSDRSSCDSRPFSDTGIPTYAMICFEVPSAPLAELRLEVARGNDVNDETRQDDVADLDLDLDPHADPTKADTSAAYHVSPSSTDPFDLQAVTIKGAS
jgi:hypothetical protein